MLPLYDATFAYAVQTTWRVQLQSWDHRSDRSKVQFIVPWCALTIGSRLQAIQFGVFAIGGQ